jgi:hypothetical protein
MVFSGYSLSSFFPPSGNIYGLRTRQVFRLRAFNNGDHLLARLPIPLWRETVAFNCGLSFPFTAAGQREILTPLPWHLVAVSYIKHQDLCSKFSFTSFSARSYSFGATKTGGHPKTGTGFSQQLKGFTVARHLFLL